MPLFRNNIIKPFEKTAKALSPMQMHILLFLRGKNPISTSELAANMDVLKQQITYLTDKLEKNNLIERVHDKKDRRFVKISITQSGINYIFVLLSTNNYLFNQNANYNTNRITY